MSDGYISVQQAQDILRVSARQVQYHAANGKLTSRKVGRRLEILEVDVFRLAEELGSDKKPPPQPAVEMLPDTGPLIDYIRDLTAQLNSASRAIGQLEGQLQSRLLPEDAEGIRQQLAEAETRAKLLEEETDRLREELRQATQPWYKKMFG